MSLLSDREWQLGYRQEDGDLIELFYNPLLERAIHYDRMTGYFNASALALAARGIERLIENDGRMRIIVGCTLDPDEQAAIGEGYDLREQIAAKLAAIDLTPPDEAAQGGLEVLAWMVAQGHLDVKVAVPVDAKGRPVNAPGIYHEKVGIVTDEEGNKLAFCGSINETASGWLNNRESFQVYCSWVDPRDSARVDHSAEAFYSQWEGRSKSMLVVEFPEAAKRKLLEFLPKERTTSSLLRPRKVEPAPHHKLLPEEYRRIVWTYFREAARLSNGIRVGEFTGAVSAWPHQIKTYVRFVQGWPCRMLIADEVGLGKTISAGLILRQAVLSGLAKRTLILTPKSVEVQWQNELYEKFNLNVPIYDGAKLIWRQTHGRQAPLEREVDRDGWQQEPIVLVSSFLMRRQERQRELTDAAEWDLIILDEAHHARRRGAGTLQEKGPNAMLALMLKLKERCRSLLMLTATPMQVHPVEIWDLLNLLGLPAAWQRDDGSFLKYFSKIAANPSGEDLEWLVALFQATEKAYRPLTDSEVAQLLPDASGLRRRKVIQALRDSSEIPRRRLDSEARRAMLTLLQAGSPLRHLMVRNTRGLLRRYAREGRLALPIAERVVKDVPVEMNPAETALYHEVEDYISDTYNAASSEKRTAVGFIMTVYRRRLASSFEALRRTLVGRLERMGGMTDEDASQDELADEVMGDEQVLHYAEAAAAVEERPRILALLKGISQLNTDSKARQLRTELNATLAEGYDSAIIFTQYTDTMEYLRDYLAEQLTGLTAASYCGSGGAYRDGSGRWVTCSKEEIKRRLKSKQVRILVCSDAAGEGLNLQYAGVLVNYDLPWNPMKVEQRIGRIDRLGQKYPVVRIVNLAYKDTVEADVFFTVGERIQMFQGIIGRLQPILSRLPKKFEEITLASREVRDAARQRFLAEIEHSVDEPDAATFDLSAASTEDLEIPPLPEPALTLLGIDRAMIQPSTRPPGTDWLPLDVGAYSLQSPGMAAPVRVTTDADVFDASSDNHQLFSPGGEVFESLESEAASQPVPNADGVCWLVTQQDGRRECVVQTHYGPQRAETVESLLIAIENIGEPGPPPYSDWPGVINSTIA